MADDLLSYIAASGRGGVRIAGPDGQVRSALGGQDVRCLASHPTEPEVLYAGTQGNGVFVSEDGGNEWAPLGLAGQVVKSLAVSPADPRRIYAGVKPAMVHRSLDGGISWEAMAAFRQIRGRRLWWSPAEPPGSPYVQGLAASPVDPDVVLAGVELGAVVRSADAGESWSTHRSGSLRDCHMLRFHHRDGNWAYEGGGTGGGAAYSRDGGISWQKAKDGLDRHYGWACAADPDRPDTWYLSASPGPGRAHSYGRAEAHIFRKRADGGWVKLSGGLPNPLDHLPYGLATLPGRPGTVVACLGNGELWSSEDYGDSWRRLPLSLGTIRPAFLVVSSTG